MATSQKVEEFKASLTILAAKIKAAAAKVRPTAFLADNADAWVGQNIAAVRTQLAATSTAHTANTNNPHGETAASVGIPLKTVVDAQLAKLIPSGVLPISRFGSLNYLPVGITGSYESGTHIGGGGYLQIPIHMEQDGTLVYLRNATDGSNQGVYYSYLQNAKTNSLSNTVLSNRRYRPAFIPSDMQVSRIFSGNGGALIGEVTRISDNGGRQLFIALCNGTLDDTKHVGSVVPMATYNPSSVVDHMAWEPQVIGTKLHLIMAMGGIYGGLTKDSVPQITVVTLNASDVIAGTIPSFATVGGWAVNGIRNNFTNQATIKIADKIASSNAADDAVFQFPATGIFVDAWFAQYGAGSLTRSQVDPATGKIRVIVMGIMRLGVTASVAVSPTVSFSIVIDPVAKTAVLDAPYVGGTNITVNATLNGLIFSNPAFTGVGSSYVSAGGLSYSGKNIVVTNDGYAFTMGISTVTEQTNTLWRSKLSNFTTPYAFIPGTGASTAVISATMAAVGPSPFMNGYRAVCLLPNGYISAMSKGTGSTWRRAIGKYANAGENPTFTYKSVTGADFLGYSPKSDRKLVDNIPSAVNTGCVLTEINAAGVITACRGGVLNTALLSRQLNFDEKMVPQDALTLSVGATPLANIATAGYTATGYPGPAKNIFAQLVVPANLANSPVLIIWALQPDGTQCMGIFLCTVTNRSGDVGAMTLGTLIGKYTGPATSNTQFGRSFSDMACGSTITEMTGGYTYTIGGLSLWAKSGGSAMNSFKFFYNTNGTVEGYAYNEYTPDYNAAHYFAMPGLGVGTMRTDAPDSDYSTKLQFASVGKTKAEVLAWKTTTRADKIVVLSQQAPVGWNIYFTDPTPLFMAGNAYVIDVAAVDLMTITASPANKTFYIYVQLVLGIPKYVVRETETAETETTMYIGYITTNGIAINQIVVSKVDRIGTFRISNTPVGSAIPSSSGHPADVGKLTWV